MQKIYRVVVGGNTPPGLWREYNHLSDYQRAANVVAKILREASDEQYDYYQTAGIDVYCGPEVNIAIRNNVVQPLDRELGLESGLLGEWTYIATAARNAMETRQRTGRTGDGSEPTVPGDDEQDGPDQGD